MQPNSILKPGDEPPKWVPPPNVQLHKIRNQQPIFDPEIYKVEQPRSDGKPPDRVFVRFGNGPVLNEFLTNAEKRPVVWTKTYAMVFSPANEKEVFVCEIELHDEHGKLVRQELAKTLDGGVPLYRFEQFRDQLRKWKDQQNTDAEGTRLDAWPQLNVNQIAALRAVGIETLEQLGAVPDSNLHSIGPGGRALRDGATAFLDASMATQSYQQLLDQNASLEQQMAQMRQQMADMMAANAAALEAMKNGPAKTKRGRPAKTTNAAPTEPAPAQSE